MCHDASQIEKGAEKSWATAVKLFPSPKPRPGDRGRRENDRGLIFRLDDAKSVPRLLGQGLIDVAAGETTGVVCHSLQPLRGTTRLSPNAVLLCLPRLAPHATFSSLSLDHWAPLPLAHSLIAAPLESYPCP